jgi:hypothetical protein
MSEERSSSDSEPPSDSRNQLPATATTERGNAPLSFANEARDGEGWTLSEQAGRAECSVGEHSDVHQVQEGDGSPENPLAHTPGPDEPQDLHYVPLADQH